MPVQKRLFTVGLLTMWSVLLTALTVVLGAVPLRGLRLFCGPLLYWALVLIVGLALVFTQWSLLGLGFLAMAVTVGVFSEVEERGYSLVSSGFSSIGITGLLLAGAFAFWISHFGAGWYGLLVTKLESYLAQIPSWQEVVKVEAKEILAQLPSMILIVLILGLFLSLLLQRRVAVVAGLKRVPIHHLRRFAVPDFFVWVFLAALAGAFMHIKIGWLEATSMNVLNVCVVVFFLQGLAVITGFFESFKVSWVWQTILLVLFVSQLFLLVSFLGLVDYWINFRDRLAKRTENVDREISKK